MVIKARKAKFNGRVFNRFRMVDEKCALTKIIDHDRRKDNEKPTGSHWPHTKVS